MGRTVAVNGSDAVAAENTGFKPLPEGKYIIQITGTEDKTVQGGDNKGKPTLNVKFKVTEAHDEALLGKKATIFGIPMFPTWASGKSAFTFYQFFKAVGVEFPKEGEAADVELPDNEDLWGEEIGVDVTIDNSGQKPQNRFAYFPASKGIGDAPAGGAAAAEDDDEFDL